jgi:hypothetical protein
VPYQPQSAPILAPPVERKPTWWEFYRTLKGDNETQASPVESAITGFRNNAEGMAVGAVLGFVKSEFGSLDINGRYPVDGIAAILLYLLSVKGGDFSADFRALSQSCSTVFAYRKVEAWRESLKNPSSITGDKSQKSQVSQDSIDPVVVAAKEAGL